MTGTRIIKSCDRKQREIKMKIDELQEVGAREKLKRILSKEPELNDDESKFLRVRRSYLIIVQVEE